MILISGYSTYQLTLRRRTHFPRQNQLQQRVPVVRHKDFGLPQKLIGYQKTYSNGQTHGIRKCFQLQKRTLHLIEFLNDIVITNATEQIDYNKINLNCYFSTFVRFKRNIYIKYILILIKFNIYNANCFT